MINRVEKLSLLSEMIAFARLDNSLKTIEYEFLLSIAHQLNITKADFEYILNNPVLQLNLNSYSERIVQFHRLVLLMNIDQKIVKRELIKIYNFGLKMGLSHDAITRVLDLMDSFPDKIVPPDFLIDLFKIQYN